MRILVLDSALARCTAAVVVDDALVAFRTAPGRQGHEATLPVMARDVMDEAAATYRLTSQQRVDPRRIAGDVASDGGPAAPEPASAGGRDQSSLDRGIDLIAVTVGPGSFTGIRAGLALAHGIGLALDVPVIGVTVGEAIAQAFPLLGDRVLWIVTDSRRGHIFLERCGEIASLGQDALPRPPHKVAIAGAAALPVAARLAATGANVMLTDARFPLPRHIALVAARRHAGLLPPRPAQPVYVDPPEAHPPAGGLRPPPVASGR